MARVACTVMLKNEVTLTAPFLAYHAALFGAKNLYVIDNGTTEPSVLKTLAKWKRRGVHVDRSHSRAEDYPRKGTIIGDLVKRLDEQDRYDLYILLDCDEFVVVKQGDGFSCDPAVIHAHLDTLRERDCIYRVGKNLSNVPGRPRIFQIADYAKTIFPRESIGETDHGHHAGWTRGGGRDFLPCDIAYVHFHFRPYEEVVRFTRQKLSVHMPPGDLDDPEKLAAHRGRGWHLVKNLISGPDAYYAQFGALNNRYEFPELLERFTSIGVPAPFSDFELPPESVPATIAPAAAPVAQGVRVVVDEATVARVRGWAIDRETPETPVFLRFRVGDVIAAEMSCDQCRPDVKRGGYLTDRVGYNFAIPAHCAATAGCMLTAEDEAGRPVELSAHGVASAAIGLAEVTAGPGAVVGGTGAAVAVKGEIYGKVDTFRKGRIEGWVLRSVTTPDGARLLGRCRVVLEQEGRIVAEAVANIPRGDVAAAMQGDDRCGYVIDVPASTARPGERALFRVKIMPEAIELSGSPCVAAPKFPALAAALR